MIRLWKSVLVFFGVPYCEPHCFSVAPLSHHHTFHGICISYAPNLSTACSWPDKRPASWEGESRIYQSKRNRVDGKILTAKAWSSTQWVSLILCKTPTRDLCKSLSFTTQCMKLVMLRNKVDSLSGWSLLSIPSVITLSRRGLCWQTCPVRCSSTNFKKVLNEIKHPFFNENFNNFYNGDTW